jgi:ABC-2 type transport system permease protein
MQAFFTLIRRELGSMFLSWTGYVILGGVSFLIGCSFVSLLHALNAEPTEQPLTELYYSTVYFWLILLLAPPLLTMRTFAQEKYSGTFETLMTVPISDLQVVVAKFMGAILFYALMWLPLLPCLLIARHYCNNPSVLDEGTLAASFVGIYLLGMVFVSAGCFASAVTRSQVIASMISLAFVVSMFVLGYVALNYSSKSGWMAEFASHISLFEHMQDFARGIIDTRPLVLCISLTALFLFLTLKVVESRRWK